jgi:hypothetical protein
MSIDLESKLGEILYSSQMEDYYFNDTYTNIVYLMKKVVEEDSYKIQLCEIGKELPQIYSSSFENYFDNMKKRMDRQFGLENTLKQVLWDAQVPENNFDNTFNEIVTMMKQTIDDKEYSTQLYKINLDHYKDEE